MRWVCQDGEDDHCPRACQVNVLQRNGPAKPREDACLLSKMRVWRTEAAQYEVIPSSTARTPQRVACVALGEIAYTAHYRICHSGLHTHQFAHSIDGGATSSSGGLIETCSTWSWCDQPAGGALMSQSVALWTSSGAPCHLLTWCVGMSSSRGVMITRAHRGCRGVSPAPPHLHSLKRDRGMVVKRSASCATIE